MTIKYKVLVIGLVLGAMNSSADLRSSFYVDANDELFNIPRSAAVAGADLALGSGTTPESSPANLPFDSLHRLSVSYANYFQNTQSTSMISYNTTLPNGIGVGITTGYVFIPDISISPDSSIPVITGSRNCSYIYLQTGLGKRFSINKKIEMSVGGALHAQRTRLIDYNGYNIGIDGGTRISFVNSGISAGLLFENISSITHWSRSYNEIARPHIRFGLGYEKDISYIYGQIRVVYSTPDLLSNEGINVFGSDSAEGAPGATVPAYKKVYKNPILLITAARAGIEYTLMRRVALRFGVTQGKLSFGGGVRLFNERAGIDFAYMTHSALSGTYQASVTYQW